MTTHWWMYWLFSVFSMSLYWYIDSRPLVDLGRYYQSIPDWWLWMEQPNSQMFWGLLSELGGWLNALLAIGVWVVNDPEPVFMFYAAITSGLFWWGLRTVPLWTGVFLLMQPIWQVMWRTQWIHALETSLLLLIWQSWRTDQITKWTGVLVMLTVWLRPSALVWVSLLWMWDCFRSVDTRRHHWLLAGMLIGCAFIFPQLTQYASGKLAVPKIEWSVLDQIGRHGGWLPTLVMLVTIVISVRQTQNRNWMPVIWIGSGLVLSLWFGVGLDNFPLLFIGLAVLAGGTHMSRWNSRMVIALTVFLNLIPFIQNVPIQASFVIHPNTILDTSYDFQRPIRKLNDFPTPEQLKGLFLQVCKGKEPHCLVVTAGALFHPHRESQGRLALLSKELKRLRIEKSELWFRHEAQLGFVDAALVQQCNDVSVWPIQFQQWASRYTEKLKRWDTVYTVETEKCQWSVLLPQK